MRLFVFVMVIVSSGFAFLACGPDRENASFAYASPDASSSASSAGLRVDESAVVSGVDDGRRDPSVVHLDGAGRSCTGVLIAGDAVLTSSVCVDAPGTTPDAIEIRESADGPPTARGARVILSPVVPTVGAAFAVLLLDRPVVSAMPTWVRSSPPIPGERLRTVGFEKTADFTQKTLRDHLQVVSGRLDDFSVSEVPCAKEEGAPAFDEDSEELVGMMLIATPCGDPYAGATYARVLPARDFLEDALDAPLDPDAGPGDAGKRLRGSKGKTVTDLREPCEAGTECSTGVCIDQKGVSTCSRECGSNDRCPTTFHCQKAMTETDAGVMVCADP